MRNVPGRTVSLATVAVIFLGILLFGVFGMRHELHIVVPDGSQGDYVFCNQELSPNNDTVTLASGKDLGEAMVTLARVDESGYSTTYLASEMSVELEVEPGAWYRVGILQENSSNERREIVVIAKGDIDFRSK